MNKSSLLAAIILLIFSCQNSSKIEKESWADLPLESWPDFALTNEIGFSDTIYYDIANSFLVNTGSDTLAVSCKHLFMVFEKQLGLKTIDLGNKFKYWNMYPKNDKTKTVKLKQLINKDSNEAIDQYNTLKVRDWILFELEEQNNKLFPLKIRYSQVKTNEIVYAIGWSMNQTDNHKPTFIKLQCIKNLGDYFYTKSLQTNTKPYGTSGSPVIDKNGYLVGIVSGQEGNAGVIGSTLYLTKMFDKYNIEYQYSSH
ncbi:serine protease [Marinifilum fragile]|uniref:S1 family peptidase n=1 Tax=Marinifilum fragile TaxID=570161 RepID=UPI002AA8B875|nr:serine protease [Marinifilum fragile]